MTADEINQLEAQVSDLIRKIDAVAKAAHPVDDDPDDGEIDASDPSVDDGDNDEDDEDDGDLGKSEVYLSTVNDPHNRPGALASSRHPEHRATIAQAVQPATRHKFDSRVDFVKERDGVTKPVAMQRARLEFPDDYANYQQFNAGTSTSEQYARRGGWGTNVGKRAPANAEDYIQVEMAKGVNREVAAQRVAQQYGFRGFDRQDAIAKRADDLESALVVAAQDIWKNSPDLDACGALRLARLQNPRLFRAMQRARRV
jgi:hypothetical protein